MKKIARRKALTLLGGSLAAPVFLRHAWADTAFTSFAFPGTGTLALRTTPSRIADIRNVVEFGADPSGMGDSQSAIQSAIAQQGTIFFPPGTYTIDSQVALPISGNYNSGESYHILGYGAFIVGNFADFLFKRAQDATGNSSPKCIEGLSFLNQNAAGGLVLFANTDDSYIVNCRGTITGGGMGFIWFSGNGSRGAYGCRVTSDASLTQNSVGISINGIGATIQNCDVTSLDRAYMAGGGGACGINVVGNRIEKCLWGITGGLPPSFQFILSTSSAAAGAHTTLHLSNTIMFSVSDTIFVSDYFGGPIPAGLGGVQTIVAKTATTLEVAVSWNSTTSLTLFIRGNNIFGTSDGNSGAGIVIAGNRSEACQVAIRDAGCSALVIQGNTIQTYWSSDTASIAGIGIDGNARHTAIQGNQISGQTELSPIYYFGQTPIPGDFTLQSNDIDNYEVAIVTQAYTNSAGPFQLYRIPAWLVVGLHVYSTEVTIPGGTTVINVDLVNTRFTISVAFTGTLPINTGFQFKNAADAVVIGQVYLG